MAYEVKLRTKEMEYPVLSEELNGFTLRELIEKCEEVGIHDEETMDSKTKLIKALQIYIENHPADVGISFHEELIRTVQSVSRGYKDKISKLRELYEDTIQRVSTTDIKEMLKEGLQEPFDYIVSEAKEGTECLKRETVPIVVVGEVSSGKSSFINNLIGENLLPQRQQHTTDVICRIQYSTDKMIRLTTAEGQLVKEMECRDTCAAREYLMKYASKGFSKPKIEYDFVDILWPVPFLKDTLEIIDTPGIDENKKIKRMVIDYMKNAASVIYMVDAANAGGIRERGENNIKKIANELFGGREHDDVRNSGVALFVFNKWDQVNECEKEEILNHNLNTLRLIWPNFSKSQVITMDSRKDKAVRRVNATGNILYSRSFRGLVVHVQKLIENSFQQLLSKHLRKITLLHIDIRDSLNQYIRKLNQREPILKKQREEITILEEKLQTYKEGALEVLRDICTKKVDIIKQKFGDKSFCRIHFSFNEKELPSKFNLIHARSQVWNLITERIPNVIKGILKEDEEQHHHLQRICNYLEVKRKEFENVFEKSLTENTAQTVDTIIVSTEDSKNNPAKEAQKILNGGLLTIFFTVSVPICATSIQFATAYVTQLSLTMLAEPIKTVLTLSAVGALFGAVVLGAITGGLVFLHEKRELSYQRNSNEYIASTANEVLKSGFLKEDESKVTLLKKTIWESLQKTQDEIGNYFDRNLENFLQQNKDFLRRFFMDIECPKEMEKELQPLLRSSENVISKLIVFHADFDGLIVRMGEVQIQSSMLQGKNYDRKYKEYIVRSKDPSSPTTKYAPELRASSLDFLLWLAVCKEMRSMKTDIVGILNIEEISLEADEIEVRTEPWEWGLSEYLKTKRKDEKLPTDVLIQVAEEITSGLHFLHRNGLTHRCLTGANVKVSKDGNMKMIFTRTESYSRASAPYHCDKSVPNRQTSLFDEYPVLPTHMAPEFIMGKERLYTREADMYSLGILLWEITYDVRAYVCHTPLAPSSSMTQFLDFLHGGGRPQAPRNGHNDLNPLKSIIELCWPQDETQRISASEVLKKLGELKNTMH